MPDILMDVAITLSAVPVNVMPLISDSDFKTRQTSVAYNAPGIDLTWNFIDRYGARSNTDVTPTTSGLHDWTNHGKGMYGIEIPAASGTINNDKIGFGWFSGFATGILPWRGPVIGFGIGSNPIFSGQADAGGSTVTMLDEARDEADATYFVGNVLEPISGAAKGQCRVITGFTPGSPAVFTFSPAMTQTMAAGDHYHIIQGADASLDPAALTDIQDQLNAALDTAIDELAVGELGTTPTPTLRKGVMALFMALRNQIGVEKTGNPNPIFEIYNDAGTKIAEKIVTDDGTDYSEAKAT